MTDEVVVRGHEPHAKRSDLQIFRRFFHMATGVFIGTVYALLLNHEQSVFILGTGACVLYFLEQIRIKYPEISRNIKWINTFVLRAEERLKESSSVPYAIAVLLTIITFPKTIALIAIFTLAISDPISAIIGIKFGRRKIFKGKSLEGSCAFFMSSFVINVTTLFITQYDFKFEHLGVSFVVSFICTIFEMIPIRIDDNLTIPLFTAFTLWICFSLFNMQLL